MSIHALAWMEVSGLVRVAAPGYKCAIAGARVEPTGKQTRQLRVTNLACRMGGSFFEGSDKAYFTGFLD